MSHFPTGGTAPSPSKMVNISEEADSDEDSFEYDAAELSAHHEEMLAPSDTVIQLPEIFQGEPLSDRKSTFQAFLAKITHKNQVGVMCSASVIVDILLVTWFVSVITNFFKRLCDTVEVSGYVSKLVSE